MKNGLSKNLSKSVALCVSVLVHLVVLGLLASADFSNGDRYDASEQDRVSEVQADFAFDEPTVFAIPQIAPPSAIKEIGPVSEESGIAETEITQDNVSESTNALDVNNTEVTNVEVMAVSEPAESLLVEAETNRSGAAETILGDSVSNESEFVEPEEIKQIEFFGAGSSSRSVVYVVDCSGSMLGLLGEVREQLKQSINSLGSDDLFYVIFFGNDSIYESGQGKLVKATRVEKKNVAEFIDGIRAAGQTNALDAVERAMRVKDDMGRPAGQVFFLTDGFDLDGEYRRQFVSHLKVIRKTLSPEASINTIGFWIGDDDKELLVQMAADTGGVFTSVK